MRKVIPAVVAAATLVLVGVQPASAEPGNFKREVAQRDCRYDTAGQTFGDRTKWGYSSFTGRWRAAIKVRFVKNMAGPKDHTIGVNDYAYLKGSFKEVGPGLCSISA